MQSTQYSQGILKGGSITVPLTSCLTGLYQSVLQIKTKNFSCRTADSKPVKQEINGTVILPPLVFPGTAYFARAVSNNRKNVYEIDRRAGRSRPFASRFIAQS